MKLSMAFLTALACATAGCVTLGDCVNYGIPVDAANRPLPPDAPQPLMVSATEVPDLSTAYMGLIKVTFENHTPVWKQVDRVAVGFGGPAKAQSVTIAAQADIEAWERALGIHPTSPDPYVTEQLLATPFRIPPGLSETRRILLSTTDKPPGGCIDTMLVSYETSDQQTSRVWVKFKVPGTDWQGPACAPTPEPGGLYSNH
jgi:hypothetical protein